MKLTKAQLKRVIKEEIYSTRRDSARRARLLREQSEPTAQEVEDAAEEMSKDPTIMAFVKKAAEHPAVQAEIEKQLQMMEGTNINKRQHKKSAFWSKPPDAGLPVAAMMLPGLVLADPWINLAAQKAVGLTAAGAFTGAIPVMIYAAAGLLAPSIGLLITRYVEQQLEARREQR